MRFWSREYRRIIDRFHRIISGQFMGHSHRDEFNVFYARNTDFAINYAWNGGATTTYSNVNPNYILYYVDRTIFVSITMRKLKLKYFKIQNLYSK